MPAPIPSTQTRPPGAPAYYLARPATWWLTAFRAAPQPSPRPAPAGPAAG